HRNGSTPGYLMGALSLAGTNALAGGDAPMIMRTWTLQSPASSPSARASAGVDFDAGTQTVTLFGGVNSSGALGDTWTWNGTTWTQQSPSASPLSRQSPFMAYDAAASQLVLFGGCVDGSCQTTLGDTWTW